MRYGGRTDVRTHNKIVPPYTLVRGSLRLAPIITFFIGSHTYVYTHIHTHAHIHTYTHTHTHTQLPCIAYMKIYPCLEKNVSIYLSVYPHIGHTSACTNLAGKQQLDNGPSPVEALLVHGTLLGK